jgi:membrane fusion protein, multidrug efflux system
MTETDAVPKRGGSFLRRAAFYVIGAGVILAIGGYGVIGGAQTPKKTPAAPASVAVQTMIVAPKSVQITRDGIGTVAAWQSVTISAEVSGRIIDLPFREGHAVRKGDVLARIDPRPLQAALDQAKAKKDQDEANLANTQSNLSRDQTLIAKGGFASQQTVDNEKAQVRVLQSAIEGDQAAIEAAETNLDFATVKAPFSGVVGLRSVDLGNLVTSTTTIGTVAQIEPVAVDFTLPQTDLADVQAAAAHGTPAVLVFDQAGKTQLAEGTLDVINNQIDQASGTIKLKARVDNKDHKLWPGAFVQVKVIIRTEPEALALPSTAVQHGPDGAYVWLVAPDQTVHMQPVQIGEMQAGQTLIASGVKINDRIVAAGQYRLTQGAHVTEAKSGQPAQEQGQS